DKGIITSIKFFGDFFGKCDVAFVENKLIGIRHEENALRNTLDSIEINDYFLGADTDILVSGILGVK
ncbi:TPA: lipoate--protein ligase family protein, partial [Clostridioides difficile]|nr:lipoate--protein ligase family protein [Clostridioides difficile]